MKWFLAATITLLATAGPLSALAAYNDVTLTTSTIISVGGILIDVSGSSAAIQSITVNSSDFSVTFQSGSSIAVTAPNLNELSASTDPAVSQTATCNTSTSSDSLTATGSATITITPSTTLCGGGTSGGAGSGNNEGVSGGSAPIKSPSSPVTTMPSTTSLQYPYARDLTLGDTGPDVAALQNLLIADGYGITAGATGYFGPQTQAALAAYQRTNTINPPAGYFGPLTRAEIAGSAMPTIDNANSITAPTNAYQFTRDLSLGSTGEDVLKLQTYLNAQGYVIALSGPGSQGNETHYFGLATHNALVKFQNAHASNILTPSGLTQGTGYFGVSTRTYINTH